MGGPTKSFNTHPRAIYWNYEKNNNRNPKEFALNSHKKCWFTCDVCNHDFDTTLNNVTALDNWCPYCKNKKLCDNQDCQDCLQKSFQQHPKSIYWSKENTLHPRQVFKNSDKKYWLDCECRHKIFMSPKRIYKEHKWCSYCAHQKLCDNNECVSCFKNSFASEPKAKYWSTKNSVNPRQAFKSSNKKYWFDCDKCEEDFSKQISDVTRGVWCPYCYHKTEQKLYDNLVIKYPELERQFKASWCKNITHLPFDFVLQDEKIIIELDGPHHFKKVSNWEETKETRRKDLHKMKCANENGYSIIRLLQIDVWKDKYNWLKELRETIEKIANDNRVQTIFMCKNNEYDNFINL
jgi:very-short-patch-repair endonuclease